MPTPFSASLLAPCSILHIGKDPVMMRCLIIPFIILGTLYAATPAQDAKKEEIKKAEKKVGAAGVSKQETSGGAAIKSADEAPVPGDVEVLFLNGSLLRMVVQTEKLDVVTRFGPLSVPVKEIRAVEFGLHFPVGLQAKIA